MSTSTYSSNDTIVNMSVHMRVQLPKYPTTVKMIMVCDEQTNGPNFRALKINLECNLTKMDNLLLSGAINDICLKIMMQHFLVWM